MDADIVIIGSALSGLCACRAAVENGAKNIVVIEKADTWQCRSNQFGTIGGKIQEDLGIKIDRNAAVGQLMKECGYRPNQRFLNLWADNSGEAFDWFLAPMEGKYVVENESDPYDVDEGHLSVRKTHWPEPDNSHTEDDFYPIFSDCQITLPTMSPWVEAIYNICVEAGVTFKFSTWARQLVRDTDFEVKEKERTAHLTEAGQPALTPFVNDVSKIDAGKTRLTVRHTAAAPAVERRRDRDAGARVRSRPRVRGRGRAGTRLRGLAGVGTGAGAGGRVGTGGSTGVGGVGRGQVRRTRLTP